jgi:hypothetical protein
MKRIFASLFFGLLLSLLACGSLWAQATAQISGGVQDSSGAVLPGTEVTVTQTETGATRMTVTNEAGRYILPNLPLGPTSWKHPATALNSAQFGKIITAQDPRLMQFALKYVF